MFSVPAPAQMDRTYPSVRDFLDQHIIQTMVECSESPLEWCFGIDRFTNDWITRDMARAILRSLTERGYCVYRRGLFNEDGEVAGAGYGLTKEGLALYGSFHPQSD